MSKKKTYRYNRIWREDFLNKEKAVPDYRILFPGKAIFAQDQIGSLKEVRESAEETDYNRCFIVYSEYEE